MNFDMDIIPSKALDAKIFLGEFNKRGASLVFCEVSLLAKL